MSHWHRSPRFFGKNTALRFIADRELAVELDSYLSEDAHSPQSLGPLNDHRVRKRLNCANRNTEFWSPQIRNACHYSVLTTKPLGAFSCCRIMKGLNLMLSEDSSQETLHSGRRSNAWLC
jgi:hypothetical protein